jgi:hypothetical protein
MHVPVLEAGAPFEVQKELNQKEDASRQSKILAFQNASCNDQFLDFARPSADFS